MIDSTNSRILADNIRALTDKAEGLSNELVALGTYSGDEIDTGAKWFGLPVYRRVLKGKTGELNASVTAIETTGMSIAYVVNMVAYVQTASYWSPVGNAMIAYYTYASAGVTPGVRVRVTNEAYVQSDLFAIIEYTKEAPAYPSSLTSLASNDTRSIEPEAREEAPEAEPIEEPVVEVKKTTRKKTTTTE